MSDTNLTWVECFAWKPVALREGGRAWLRKVYYRPELRGMVLFVMFIPTRWTWEYTLDPKAT